MTIGKSEQQHSRYSIRLKVFCQPSRGHRIHLLQERSRVWSKCSGKMCFIFDQMHDWIPAYAGITVGC